MPDGSLFVHTVMTCRGPADRGVASVLPAEAERPARAHRAPALALDHWAGSPELGRVDDGYGNAEVAEYTSEHDGGARRTTVRVRHLHNTD
ncbi:hypothetical protein SAMN05421505_105235 [Sinosporangium album]|uniref:Uncharacterized protein n=1 Tax=Sinosporangium album TaxID=504805 RepID=A0A1G7VEA7_9ACTN|nr:hypothetical protein [Sinosporangium album]SDG58063.1 hypothetical protein SAMN05421505_105235 [Sinosporangium album]